MSTHSKYSYPSSQPRSACYKVSISGEELDVLRTGVADFVAFECDGPVDLTIRLSGPVEGAVIRPMSRGLSTEVCGETIRLSLPGPQNLCLDVKDRPPLFIYANSPETDRPERPAYSFAAGKVHDVGELELKSGQTMYIEAGAVVRGCVRAWEARDVRVCGRGVLDGSFYSRSRGETVRSIVFEQCENAVVSDIVMIEPSSWMIVLGGCRGARVQNVKQIGEVVGSDGIDVCGSRDILIEGCCLCNNDDNIAIKAVKHKSARLSWDHDVKGVTVKDCVLWNGPAGNAMEIGYELRTERVSDILFQNIDVLCVHGHGAVFSIHNGDRATVQNVRWENIRIEHHYDKLLDFRVVSSRYSIDPVRGRIRNVVLKNILVHRKPPNLGHTVSVISGTNANEPVETVVIEDLFFDGQKVTNADELDLYTRNAVDVSIR